MGLKMKMTYIKVSGVQEMIGIKGDHINKVYNALKASTRGAFEVLDLEADDGSIKFICLSEDIIYGVLAEEEEESEEEQKA
jgi:hypothetical protein